MTENVTSLGVVPKTKKNNDDVIRYLTECLEKAKEQNWTAIAVASLDEHGIARNNTAGEFYYSHMIGAIECMKVDLISHSHKPDRS